MTQFLTKSAAIYFALSVGTIFWIATLGQAAS